MGERFRTRDMAPIGVLEERLRQFNLHLATAGLPPFPGAEDKNRFEEWIPLVSDWLRNNPPTFTV